MFIRNDDKITTTQTSIFITDSVLGAGILTLPRGVIEAAQTPDVWLSVLLGGIIVILVTMIMVKLSQKFPNDTVYQYSKRIVGSVPGGVLSICLIIYYIIIAGFEIRVLAEVTLYYLLEGTPIWAIVIPFIWVGTYICFGGINSIARVFQIIFPISILILVFSYFLSIRLFDINNLRPVLSEGVVPVFKGLKSTVLIFTGCEVIMTLVAHMQHPERAVRATFAGIGVPFVLYLMTVVVVIGGMSVDSVMNSTWPTIDLLRSFEITGLIFERFEFPFLVIWMMQLFCNFTSFYFNASLGISQVFNLKIHPVIFGLIPVIFITTMLPKRINEVFKLGDSIGKIGIFLFFLVPVLLTVILFFRKKVLNHHV
ncbi:spore gernimation protein [Paenibacillus sp. BIHB 4019]|uniref:Spore gernimation protein n=1 Tax=Paenibacillus sp. BIHB 4019 TaxID=1870819 RepID=A0A1B2DQR2_9BACL|nr:GerAB/ArcD/ProY family transporter [Paenibacillus sp. BIHB 4019]ANY70041.1 spore gernimation protein [Paenibacillus sp. BIHB 4019]